eukprot:180385-Amorphochlora_amoeboformis.AAC.1
MDAQGGAVENERDGKSQDRAEGDQRRFIMRMNCELSLCGNVLGKGGQKIRKMNKDSGAHISLSEYIKGATHRTAKITGNVEAGHLHLYAITP